MWAQPSGTWSNLSSASAKRIGEKRKKERKSETVWIHPGQPVSSALGTGEVNPLMVSRHSQQTQRHALQFSQLGRPQGLYPWYSLLSFFSCATQHMPGSLFTLISFHKPPYLSHTRTCLGIYYCTARRYPAHLGCMAKYTPRCQAGYEPSSPSPQPPTETRQWLAGALLLLAELSHHALGAAARRKMRKWPLREPTSRP